MKKYIEMFSNIIKGLGISAGIKVFAARIEVKLKLSKKQTILFLNPKNILGGVFILGEILQILFWQQIYCLLKGNTIFY